MNKLKRVVIKEELVAITGDFILAVILNQFLYWSDRVRDFDKLLLEEKERAEKDGAEVNIDPANGWIYKRAEELIDETMLGISIQSMRRNITRLVMQGYLFERNNPRYKWDRTKQYRVNFQKIKDDLKEKGYTLDGYKITGSLESEVAESPNKFELPKWKFEDIKNNTSYFQNGNSSFQNGNSSFQNGNAIPETTLSETTLSETTLSSVSFEAEADKKDNTTELLDKKKRNLQFAVDYINQHAGDETIAEKIFAVFRTRARGNKDVTIDVAKMFLRNLTEWSGGDYNTKIAILDKSIAYDAITLYQPDRHYKSSDKEYTKPNEAPSYNIADMESSYDVQNELAWAYQDMENRKK